MPDPIIEGKYSSGETPMYGDMIKGTPNNMKNSVAGILLVSYDDGICVLVLRPGAFGEAVRLYGEVRNFALLARNDKEFS